MKSLFRFALITLTTMGALLLPVTLAEAQLRSPRRSVTPSSLPNTVGQIDPAETVEIIVTNSLPGDLGIGFSGGPNVELDPGEEVTVSFATVPLSLFIYPFDREVSIQQTIGIEENTIFVEILDTNDVAPGDLSINVDRGGSVYIF
jgi:hypothetical protein